MIQSDYRVQLVRGAMKQFRMLPEPIKTRVAVALQVLSVQPRAGKALQGDMKGLRSLRVWPFRIIYIIFPSERIVEVRDIAHRQGIYK